MIPILSAAFAAGMVSTVNPCGFAMLPAYLGYFLGEPGTAGRGRIGIVASAVAAGFLAVFTVAGILIGLGLRAVVSAIPWLALVVGIGLVVVGVGQILGRRLLPYLRGPSRVDKSGSVGGMFLFGVSYAIASLSCTLPIFLSLVSGAVASRTPLEAVATFAAYGAGMAVVVVGITALVAGGRRTIIDRIRPLARRVDAVSGWIMTAAGVFIVWYWATVLSDGSVALGSNGLVRAIDRLSSSITDFVAEQPLVVAAALIVLTVGTLALRRSHTGDGDQPDESVDGDRTPTASSHGDD